MSTLRVAAGVVLAAVLTVGTAALSRAPVTFAGPDDAALRLVWRTQGASIEECRQPTPEELEELPVHMRNPRACIGQLAAYVLAVRLDGTLLAADTLHAAGARGDRPMHILRELPMSVGSHDVVVDFRAILPEGAVVAQDAVTHLSWSGVVTLGPRDVALVTTDGTGRALELRTPEARP